MDNPVTSLKLQSVGTKDKLKIKDPAFDTPSCFKGFKNLTRPWYYTVSTVQRQYKEM